MAAPSYRITETYDAMIIEPDFAFDNDSLIRALEAESLPTNAQGILDIVMQMLSAYPDRKRVIEDWQDGIVVTVPSMFGDVEGRGSNLPEAYAWAILISIYRTRWQEAFLKGGIKATEGMPMV